MFKRKAEIEAWLTRYKVLNYTINDDLTVDVDDNVYLDNKALYELPVQFGKVNGDFEISNNYLKSLKGCPHTVIGGFYCPHNELNSLNYGPKIISGEYVANNNNIKSLNHLAEGIEIQLSIYHNPLNSLKNNIDKDIDDFIVLSDIIEGFESYQENDYIKVPIEDVQEYYKKLKLFKKLDSKLPEINKAKKNKI